VPYKESLRTFGEVAIVHDAKTLNSKLENRGVPCLFVGYVDNHPRDMFHMFNMETKHVWCTRDTKWVATDIATYDRISKNENTSWMQTYNEYDDDYDYDGSDNRQNINQEKDNDANDNDADDNANDVNNNDANNHKDDDDDDKHPDEDIDGTSMTVDPPTSRTLREMRHLATYFNPVATNYVTQLAPCTQATHAIENTDDASDAHDSASTCATDHQSGREEASEAEPDQISGGDLDDHESKSTPEQISDGDPDLASLAIDFLPHFAFYSTNHFVELTNMPLASIDLNEAYVQQPILVEPTTFREAYGHPDLAQQEKWRAAIRKEFNDMTRRGVWCKVPCTAIPKG